MSDHNKENDNVNVSDSTNESHQDDDNVKDLINVEVKEVISSTTEAQVQDYVTSDHVPSSPSPPPAPPSPHPPWRPPRRAAAAPPHPRLPPSPMPHGPPFMMPAGLIHPFYNQPMMMPPPPHFQNLAPYGQPFIPYGYRMIPYPPNPWSTGPFDCFSDAKNCCLTCCCPCITFGQIAEILNEGQTPWWEHAAGFLVLDSITFSLGTFLYAWPYRVKMRTKFWLRGKLLWDFMFSFFCTRVSLCQQYRQLSHLGFDVPLGWEANREKMRIKALENMYRMHQRQITPPAVEREMYR